MTGVIAIDPGYASDGEGCACAYFGENGRVCGTWFMRPREAYTLFAPLPEMSVLGHRLAHTGVVVVEQPQQDGRTYGIPPEVLAKLSWDGALLAGLYAGRACCEVRAYTPSQWKGSLAKAAHHSLMWKVLTEDERVDLGGDATWRVIDAACERGALARWKPRKDYYYPKDWATHNLLDAVALGLTHLGRMKKP